MITCCNGGLTPDVFRADHIDMPERIEAWKSYGKTATH
jgi:hypothetical protein